jgi:hypothetical protein
VIDASYFPVDRRLLDVVAPLTSLPFGSLGSLSTSSRPERYRL